MTRDFTARRAKVTMGCSSDEIDWPLVVAGDHDSFTRVFDRHSDLVYRFVRRRTNDSALAEDVVSQVFLEAWRQRDRVSLLDGSLRSWLLGVARNLVSRHWRSVERAERATKRLAIDQRPATAEADIGDHLDNVERMAAVRSVLAAMPAGQRDVLLLSAWEHLILTPGIHWVFERTLDRRTSRTPRRKESAMNEFDVRRLIADEEGLALERRQHLKEQLMETIGTEDMQAEIIHARARRRGRIAIATGCVAGLAVLGSVAAASGLFLSAAQSLLPGSCRNDSSVETLVASAVLPSGKTVQMFTTQPDGQPVNGAAVIEVGPDGEFSTGGGSCGSVSPDALPYEIFDPGELWVMGPYTAGSDGIFMNLAGAVPATASSVRIDLSDGTTVNVDTEPGGYFLAPITRPGVEMLPDGLPPAVPEPIHIAGLDEEGLVISETDL